MRAISRHFFLSCTQDGKTACFSKLSVQNQGVLRFFFHFLCQWSNNVQVNFSFTDLVTKQTEYLGFRLVGVGKRAAGRGMHPPVLLFQLDLVLNSEEGGDLSDFITNGEWYLLGESTITFFSLLCSKSEKDETDVQPNHFWPHHLL